MHTKYGLLCLLLVNFSWRYALKFDQGNGEVVPVLPTSGEKTTEYYIKMNWNTTVPTYMDLKQSTSFTI